MFVFCFMMRQKGISEADIAGTKQGSPSLTGLS
jgi:hypothetical protein